MKDTKEIKTCGIVCPVNGNVMIVDVPTNITTTTILVACNCGINHEFKNPLNNK